MNATTQKGFTLIELMIVIAIIGILAAIAIPQYQNYIAKSQVSRVMSEVASMRTATETCLNDGISQADCGFGWTDSNLLEGGAGKALQGTTGLLVTFATAATESTTLEAEFGANASQAIDGKNLTWTRSPEGSWTCSTSVDPKYKPAGCSGSGS
ncbi:MULTISPECIES: pilin [unclassified Psychrobacter]|uniref:pilin n=1 Tax=unclassified Psychrobacter TaxID=196806 RepID=UPI00071E91C8|nr:MULTISPECIES: pilin [unclassified Psychrobacter]OLF37655.1 prepilin-type N-terminal cleavage/methylation domain-containing protein [Psychrobacter sp. Cmf 22.2]